MSKKNSLEKRRISVVNTVLLCILMVLVASPLYVMVVGAFKPNSSLNVPPIDLNPFNGEMTLLGFEKVIGRGELQIWLPNSFIIATSVAVLTTAIGMMGGYAFARLKFWGKKALFALVIATMIMPKAVMMIPNFLVAKSLNLVDTMIGIILTSIGPAFAVFLSRQCIQSLPSELFEAAEIDGSSEPGKFFRIAVPLALPSLGAATIFSFFGAFNDYTWQLIMVQSNELYTVPIGLAKLGSGNTSVAAVPLASAFLVSIPLLVLFLCFQKVFVKGATVGAVKG